MKHLTSIFKKFVLYAYGYSKLSPSVVYTINNELVETFFYDDGKLYGSASTCAKVNDVVLLGSPNKNLMACFPKE